MINYISYTKIPAELSWRAEDSSLGSKILPIFSIADGITMTRDGKMDYDEEKFPTPPRITADIFCQKTIEFLEKRYPTISKKEIISSYNFANDAIKEFYFKNKVKHEFGCTGAVVAVLKDKIIGSRFLDSGFALIRKGKIFFKTPEFWSWKKENEPEKPYPYINLNKDLSDLVQTYEINFELNDILVLFTDGFEKQFSETEFLDILNDNDLKAISEKLEKIDKILKAKNPKEYGHERTLLISKL